MQSVCMLQVPLLCVPRNNRKGDLEEQDVHTSIYTRTYGCMAFAHVQFLQAATCHVSQG
jgi:hypothetical protein